jgi:Ser-tRNA(Ala) deacylase AlaX
MSTKIGLHIGGRRFDVDVEEKFARFLEKQMEKDFNMEGNNDLKALLQAYVRKNHELYVQNQQVEEILEKLDNEDKIL